MQLQAGFQIPAVTSGNLKSQWILKAENTSRSIVIF
uniref:Uncharacterized protein n=1 Tax=Arundo donax TaxID=35708 RepID=A0A0A8YQ63_ARUDO